MRSASTDSKTPYNYAHTSTPKAAWSHRYNAAKKKANRPQPHPPHRRGTFHRRLQPLYTEKHKVSCSGFLPNSPLPFLTASLRHHFPSSPLPFVTTSLPHHSPSLSLPFVTTSHRHHFPSSPLPFVTTSHRHHFPSSPLPFVTTSLRHHFPSSTSHRHHFPSSPLPFVHFPSSPSLRHHFPSSPLPFVHFPVTKGSGDDGKWTKGSMYSHTTLHVKSHTTLHQGQVSMWCIVMSCKVSHHPSSRSSLNRAPPFIISSLRILFVRNTEVLLPNFLWWLYMYTYHHYKLLLFH